MLVRLKRLDDQVGMRVMPGQDSDRIDLLVIQNLLVVRGGIRKAEFQSRVTGMQTAGRGNTHQLNILYFFDRWKQGGIGEQPGAQNAQPDRSPLDTERVEIHIPAFYFKFIGLG
jgi:hypothetical protein